MAVVQTMFALLALPGSAWGAPLPADQAQAHIGEIATIQGRAHVQRTRDGETYLYVGGTGPAAPFSAYVSRWNAVKFQDVDHLDGKEVQITGLISTFRHKPEIFLTDPGQIAAK
jgi:hypothetical protein